MALTNTVTESLVHDIPSVPSLALPLIDNLTYAILDMVEVFHLVIGDVLGLVTETGELGPHLVASDTVGVKGLVEVGDDETLQVEVGSTPPILNALDCC